MGLYNHSCLSLKVAYFAEIFKRKKTSYELNMVIFPETGQFSKQKKNINFAIFFLPFTQGFFFFFANSNLFLALRLKE